MTAGEFKDLLNVADYSKAKGCAVEDITKHGIVGSIGDRKYLVKVGHGCVQSESGPFFLDLAPSVIERKRTSCGSVN